MKLPDAGCVGQFCCITENKKAAIQSILRKDGGSYGSDMTEDRKPERKKIRIILPNDICVCCGLPVPEGRQVCWACEHGEITIVDGIKGKRYEGVKRF